MDTLIMLVSLLAVSACASMFATALTFNRAGLRFTLGAGLVLTLALWAAILWIVMPMMSGG